MKKSEAAQILRGMMLTIQKFRSTLEGEIMPPDLDEGQERMIRNLHPFITGPKCPFDILVKALDQYEDTGELEGMFLYNMVLIATYFEPDFGAGCRFMGFEMPDWPSPLWATGLEEG